MLLIMSFVHVYTQYDCKIKIIKTDNGKKFNMQNFYTTHGIIHQTFCVEISQQNSKVERKHRHLLEVTRAFLFHPQLPKFFWSYYIVCHDTFIINCLPIVVLANISPFEVLHNSQPTILYLKVFGCLAYASTISHNRTKLDNAARKCIFLSFQPGTKGYLFFDLLTYYVFLSRNVFYENIFP